jgi:hypothetical protein
VSQCAANILFAVRQLSELVGQVKDEQGYIVVRERTHRNTAESTNARVKWWNIFQLIFLIGEGIFQVWWLKRFFEVSISIRLEKDETDSQSAGQACCLKVVICYGCSWARNGIVLYAAGRPDMPSWSVRKPRSYMSRAALLRP